MFIFLFGIGGLTGLFLGALATDVVMHDTYFVVAHFHYTMMGGVLVAFLGGLHYWWPKMTGRMFNDLWGRGAALLVFVGFNLTFFPQFLAGTHGMPRRYYTYDDKFHVYQALSSIGSLVLTIAFVTIFCYLLHSLFRGKRAPANPWGSATLEWQCSSPPPHDNFKSPPPVGDPYDYTNMHYDPEIRGYVPNQP
jgi:cytochrome c oxidase subunit 1